MTKRSDLNYYFLANIFLTYKAIPFDVFKNK